MFQIEGKKYVCVNDEVYLVDKDGFICHKDGSRITNTEFQWDCNDRKKMVALERECAELRFKCALLEDEQRYMANMTLGMFIKLKFKYWIG